MTDMSSDYSEVGENMDSEIRSRPECLRLGLSHSPCFFESRLTRSQRLLSFNVSEVVLQPWK